MKEETLKTNDQLLPVEPGLKQFTTRFNHLEYVLLPDSTGNNRNNPLAGFRLNFKKNLGQKRKSS